jgi:hypothetical protein
VLRIGLRPNRKTPTNEPLFHSTNRMAHRNPHSIRHRLFSLSHAHLKEVYIARSRVLGLASFPSCTSTPNPVSLDWSTSPLKRPSSSLFLSSTLSETPPAANRHIRPPQPPVRIFTLKLSLRNPETRAVYRKALVSLPFCNRISGLLPNLESSG